MNQILSSIEFMACQLIALLILCAYIGYFIAWVRKHFLYELYKLNNVFRAVCLACMCLNTYAGLVVMIAIELIFIVVDTILYKENKINKKTYGFDRALTLACLICVGLIAVEVPFLIAIGLILGLIMAIKIYYVVVLVYDWYQEKRRRELTDLSISEEVHKSQKQSQYDPTEKHNESDYKIN